MKLKNSKKGDISVQMLIWVALGLVVLIVMIALLMGKVKFFTDNSFDKCVPAGGSCVGKDAACGDGKINCGPSE